VARLAYSLFGTWVPGLRVFSWIAGAATVYLTGRLAARISGSGVAATVAAVAASSCLLLVGVSHNLSLGAFEPLLVVAVVHVLLRLTQGGDPRLWVAAGGLAGLAVLMKYTAAPLILALLAGIAITPARRALRTPWALAGAAFGFLVVLPNLAWQASRGFPFLEMVHAAVTWKNTPSTPPQFLLALLREAGLNTPVWVGGLAWLLFAPRARAARFMGVGGLIQLLALTFGHAKPYYAAALVPILVAGGGVAIAERVRSATVRWAYGALVVATAIAFAPLAIPILPLDTLVRYLDAVGVRPPVNERLEQSVLPQDYADEFGWRELTAGVARVYRSRSRPTRRCSPRTTAWPRRWRSWGQRTGCPAASPSRATTSSGSGGSRRDGATRSLSSPTPARTAAGVCTASRCWVSSSRDFPTSCPTRTGTPSGSAGASLHRSAPCRLRSDTSSESRSWTGSALRRAPSASSGSPSGHRERARGDHRWRKETQQVASCVGPDDAGENPGRRLLVHRHPARRSASTRSPTSPTFSSAC